MSAIASLPVKVDSAGRVTDSWQFPALPSAADLPDAPADPATDSAAGAGAGAGAGGAVSGDGGDGEAKAAGAGAGAGAGGGGDRRAMHAVVRSKGFVWLANCHQVRLRLRLRLRPSLAVAVLGGTVPHNGAAQSGLLLWQRLPIPVVSAFAGALGRVWLPTATCHRVPGSLARSLALAGWLAVP